MAMSPVGLGTKNNCAGKGQQQFSGQSVESVLGCTASSSYLAKTNDDRITNGRLYVCCSCSDL
jgi:hypothetical protein